MMNNKLKLEILKNRIELLSKGLLPPQFEGKSLKNLAAIGVGAGPQGKLFQILSKKNNITSSMISVPIYSEEHHLAKYALKTKLGKIPGTIIVENGVILKSCLPPKFINKSYNNNEIIPILKHCYNTCTTVLGFHCIHFENNEGCKYCEIDPVGKKIKNLPNIHPIQNLVDAIKFAIKSENIRSFTITSGTFSKPDDVAKYFIKTLKKLKKETNISYHIQLEPIEDLSLLDELSKYASTIGIFLEIFNEKIRKEICPGKSRISKEKYIKTWEAAVRYFGKGNVMTTCLLGFNENYNDILKDINYFSKIGVRTSLLFTRFKSKNLKNVIPTYLIKDPWENINLHLEAVKIMAKNDILFEKGKGSGCTGCQGCTAMMEAAEVIKDTLIT